MKLFRYLKSLNEANSGQSSKAFAVVISSIISGLMGLTLCGAVAYDVALDGKIDSDMQDMGLLMLCMGGFVGGSSASKIFGERAEGKFRRQRLREEIPEYEPEINEEEEQP